MDPPERTWRLCAILKWLRCAEFPKLSRRRQDNSRFSPLIGERHTRCLVSINSAAQSRQPPAMLGSTAEGGLDEMPIGKLGSRLQPSLYA